MDDKRVMDWAAEKTITQVWINNIEQKLYMYDNIPDDAQIVKYVLELRMLYKKLRDLDGEI